MTRKEKHAGISGALKKFRSLMRGKYEIASFKPTYNEDCLVTNHWLSNSRRFDTAYKKAVGLGIYVDPHIKWRAHVACWAAEIGAKLGGDFVECGVNRGFLSRIIVDYLGTTPDFYLLDTYQGFDERYISEKQKNELITQSNKNNSDKPWQFGMYNDCHSEVLTTFNDQPQVKIIKGPIPDTLNQVKSQSISYLSVDLNCAAPEIAALEYFWPKLTKGAYVVLDDYGHIGHEEQRDAFDMFSIKYNTPVLSLPTGQGIFVKT